MGFASRVSWVVLALGATGSMACGDEPAVAPDDDGGEGGAGARSAAGAAGEGGAGAPVARELDDYYPVPAASGVAPTPPMGWNSWNQFHCGVSADLVMEIADAMVDSGMRDAGYEYVNIDDCWLDALRASDGRLQPAADFYSDGGDLLVSRVVVRSCAGAGGAGGAGTPEPGRGGAPAHTAGGGAGGAGGAGTPATSRGGAPGDTAGGGADPGGTTGVDGEDCEVTVYEANALDPTNGTETATGWSLRPGARVTVDHLFSGGPTEVTVTATGSLGERAWPELRLRVGDVQVGEALAADDDPRDHRFSFDAPAGTHVIEVRAASGNDGMAPIADHVHALGLKLGLYADRGRETCGHRAGSGGHEPLDASTFAAWGIDYLKYDNCAADEATIEQDYRRMGEALAPGTVYSLCAWKFYEWGVGLGHLWRTTSDIEARWESILGNARVNYPFAPYAGPNGWNDPDMLEVGVGGGMTHAEQQAHFALWAMMAAPLIAGNDLRSMSEGTLAILTNPEVIAVNQDALGLQGVPVRFEMDGLEPSHSVWSKPLNESGARAVLLLNASTTTAELGFELAEVGLGEGRAEVRDLIARTDLAPIDATFRASVPGHEAVMLKVVGNEPPVPRGTAHLSDLIPIRAFGALGPVERDTNNGNSASGDGGPIRLDGEEFGRGIGLAAPAQLIYRLGRRCSRFTATAGIDDYTNGRGSAVIQVRGDGEPLFESEVLTGTSAPVGIDVEVSGLHRLELRVTNAADGSAYDRVSFGDAILTCDE